MSPSSAPGSPVGSDEPPTSRIAGVRYARYIALFGLIVLAAITVNAALTPSSGASGIAPGQRIPPFAAPLALGGLAGDVNVARHPHEGQAGKRAACAVRGARILNICELYEQGPVVLALFVDGGSCPAVLDDMQKLARSFPHVRFAAVAIKGDAGGVSKLIHSSALTFPVALDRDGSLVALYQVATCPQVTFIYPGGVVQSAALLSRPSLAQLRSRVAQLVSASRAHGWKPPRVTHTRGRMRAVGATPVGT